MRRHKHIMEWTKHPRIYKAYYMKTVDPWDEHGCWFYKRAEKNWKTYRRTQWRER